jgi:hypothetical protein
MTRNKSDCTGRILGVMHCTEVHHMTAHKKIERTAPHSEGTGALPITRFAAEYGVHPTTVWRALRDGRLEYVVIGKRKLVLPPLVQREVAP